MVLAAGLIFYGISGLLIVAVVTAGAFRGLDHVAALSASLEEQRQSLDVALETASQTIASTATSVSGMRTSLVQAQTSLTDAAKLANDVSTTMGNLSGALNLTILGSQPFAGASQGFVQAAAELHTLSTELGSNAAALGTNATDTLTVQQQLARLVAATDSVRDGLHNAPQTAVSGNLLDDLRLVLVALMAWLSVQAVAALVIGAWWLVTIGRLDRGAASLVSEHPAQ